MNQSVKMSVSAMTRHGENKAIYVLFTDEGKTAEFTIPEVKLLNNKGFSDEEIASLKDYVTNEQDYIYSIARNVDPMKAFIGEWK